MVKLTPRAGEVLRRVIEEIKAEQGIEPRERIAMRLEPITPLDERHAALGLVLDERRGEDRVALEGEDELLLLSPILDMVLTDATIDALETPGGPQLRILRRSPR